MNPKLVNTNHHILGWNRCLSSLFEKLFKYVIHSFLINGKRFTVNNWSKMGPIRKLPYHYYMFCGYFQGWRLLDVCQKERKWFRNTFNVNLANV